MKYILIGGFGEDETIFQKLSSRLPVQPLVLSLWNLVPDSDEPALNAERVAQEMVQQYGIGKEDVIIGHSTGGWLALYIKSIVNCTVVQIASWHDPKKIQTPVRQPGIIYFAARSGLYFNSLVYRWSLRSFRNSPSKEIYSHVFHNLMQGPKAKVVNQLRIIFNPTPHPLNVKPDLSIHARKDTIIQCPDEPFEEVPGDHFSLYTYPDEVSGPILSLLARKGLQ